MVTIRPATIKDLPEIVALFHDDIHGRSREIPPEKDREGEPGPLSLRYVKSMEEIQAQPGNDIVVAEIEGGGSLGSCS